MNKLTYLISGVGFFILIISWIQWFFRFPDLSQLFLGTGISICLLGFAYIHWWMKLKDKEIMNLEKRIEGVIKMYCKNEFED